MKPSSTSCVSKAIRTRVSRSSSRATLSRPSPPASYFLAADGKRTSIFVFDLKDSSDIPSIAEPWFQTVNAAVTFTPVMNASDLRTGLEKLPKSR